MAYQMAYKDERLTEHPARVWLPMFVAFDHGSKSGRIVFNGYSSLAALGANAPVIGQKSYDTSGDIYLSIVGGPVAPGSASVLDAVSSACYQYASTISDKDDGEGGRVPFFDGATEFTIPTSPPPVSPPPPPVSPPPPPPAPPTPEDPEVVPLG